jgi:hypothetical protein
MTFSDYLIDISLIALVLPLGIVVYVAYSYLKGIPTAHNDLFLVVGAAVVGATLGTLAGKFTKVTRGADGVFAKAGLAAAGLWILGTGGRLAFQVWATHGGGPAIAHFSATHGITSATAWTSALILMALSEATTRTGVLTWRSGLLFQGAGRSLGTSAPSAPVPPVSSRRCRSRRSAPAPPSPAACGP